MRRAFVRTKGYAEHGRCICACVAMWPKRQKNKLRAIILIPREYDHVAASQTSGRGPNKSVGSAARADLGAVHGIGDNELGRRSRMRRVADRRAIFSLNGRESAGAWPRGCDEQPRTGGAIARFVLRAKKNRLQQRRQD